jgi:C-terminal processing protease CtpA/Prc
MTTLQVGIALHRIEIDDVIVGGPAYDSKLLGKGDAIIQVDRVDVSAHNIQQCLVGSDIPESTVVLKVRKASGRVIDVVLKRIAASVIADRYNMLSLFDMSGTLPYLANIFNTLTQHFFRS